jgi:hypothetical protein
MSISTVNWPIGFVPIAFFLYGFYQIGRMFILGAEVDNDSYWSFLGIASASSVFTAWAIGCRQHIDFTILKFILFSLVGVAAYLVFSGLVLPSSEYAKKWSARLESRSNSELVTAVFFGFIAFFAICLLVGLVENYIGNDTLCPYAEAPDVGVQNFSWEVNPARWALYGCSVYSQFFS